MHYPDAELENQEQQKKQQEKTSLQSAIEKDLWEVLDGFSNMVENLFSGKDMDDKKKKEQLSGYQNQARIILKDPDLNSEWKEAALKKLYKGAQSDSAVIPDKNADSTISEQNTKEAQEQFNETLLKTIDANRKTSEENNQLLARNIAEQDIPPGASGNTEKRDAVLNETLEKWP